MAAGVVVLAATALVVAGCGSSTSASAAGQATTSTVVGTVPGVPTPPSDGAQIGPIAPQDAGGVQVCQTERQEIVTAYQSAHLMQQAGGADTAGEYIVGTITYFNVPTGATTGPITRTKASLRLVPDAAPCADISVAEVPVGSH